jgi:glucan phosphoethanolaminetransferase (alkaline phosphatase superfamily)
MENKRGITTLGLVFIIFLAFFMLIILAVLSYSVGIADNRLSSLNLTIGNTTWNNTYQEVMHPGMETLRTTTPQIISIGTFFGMILCLLFVGISVRPKSNLWIILDIGILIVCEIVAVVISQTFRDSILHLNPELLTVFSGTLSTGSKFILNLPTIIPTAGVLVILATYLFNKEEVEEQTEEAINTGGFY